LTTEGIRCLNRPTEKNRTLRVRAGRTTLRRLAASQGRTGQSWGKQALKLRLLSESTGQPIGAGMAFVRDLAHIVDSLACYLGWLWPLWDAKRQTFADKLVKTVVTAEG